MARRFWMCRKCSHRNERTASRKCLGCGEQTKPKTRVPKHAHALRDVSFDQYAELNKTVHGVDELTCALCGGPGPENMRLNRDHAHHSGGYARGLVHFRCNAILGQVERGNPDAEELLILAYAYLRRSRLHHEAETCTRCAEKIAPGLAHGGSLLCHDCRELTA